ncbi:hypothetical protein K1T71_009502 [Dendrolimus kikuchii]|uniref:Uncharacterized protein n=1 Tax=Dendrolimus kikuchii TaxID=765133 RepID=A0ACC1CUW5_9NEOP|nr:hypothetical protein K1T71_009502 [Dendrolimus kikuchii]
MRGSDAIVGEWEGGARRAGAGQRAGGRCARRPRLARRRRQWPGPAPNDAHVPRAALQPRFASAARRAPNIESDSSERLRTGDRGLVRRIAPQRPDKAAPSVPISPTVLWRHSKRRSGTELWLLLLAQSYRSYV